jgi:uncharacterized protein with GYD domain
MAYYLLQGSYTAESWKNLVNEPRNRVDVVRSAVEKLGGSVEGAWFSFGDYDVVLIMQMPDEISAAAFSLAVAAGGAFKSHKTTPLMTIADGIEAMKKAGETSYHPPSG